MIRRLVTLKSCNYINNLKNVKRKLYYILWIECSINYPYKNFFIYEKESFFPFWEANTPSHVHNSNSNINPNLINRIIISFLYPILEYNGRVYSDRSKTLLRKWSLVSSHVNPFAQIRFEYVISRQSRFHSHSFIPSIFSSDAPFHNGPCPIYTISPREQLHVNRITPLLSL